MSKHIGERMNGAKIDEFLQEEGLGALGFASGGEAYAVPIAFAFDEDGNGVFLVLYHRRDQQEANRRRRNARRVCRSSSDRR